MKVLIYGIGGAMGKMLFNAIKEDGSMEVACGIDRFLTENTFNVPVFNSAQEVNIPVDVIIDFSVHSAVYDYLPYAAKQNIPCVIATTGHSESELELIKKSAESIPVLNSGNMSMGVNLLLSLVKKAAEALDGKADIEIIEKHHNKKADSPSGTAKMLAKAADIHGKEDFVYGREGIVGKRGKEIGIHAVRGGTIVGKHDVMFILNSEVITLSHEAESKMIFAEGAIKAASFLVGKQAGLYSMRDIFA